MDEPTSGLDPEAAHNVLELIKDLCIERRRTVFLCTHNLDEAQRLCDTVAIIGAGRVVAQGSPKELEERLWSQAEVVVELEEGSTAVAGAITGAIKKFAAGEPAVEAIGQEAKNLRITLQSQRQVPDLVAEIVKAGGRIRAVQPVRHSLEETYLKLMGGAGDELAKH